MNARSANADKVAPQTPSLTPLMAAVVTHHKARPPVPPTLSPLPTWCLNARSQLAVIMPVGCMTHTDQMSSPKSSLRSVNEPTHVGGGGSPTPQRSIVLAAQVQR